MKTTDELCEIAHDTFETAAAAHSVEHAGADSCLVG